MANEEHLARLKNGVDAWNKWRVENLDVIPNLVEADLRRANLGRANFAGADLREASLRRANLRGAYLTRADLEGASLEGANLIGADLRSTVGLSCEALWEARNWRDSIRDAELECEPPTDADEEDTPEPPLDPAIEEIPPDVEASMPPENPIEANPDLHRAMLHLASEDFAAARRYIVGHRSAVIEEAGEVKQIVVALRSVLQSLRLNSPEAAQADALMAKMPGCIDEFIAKLNEPGDEPDEEATIDAAQRIYGQAMLDTLQAWYDVPAGRVVLGTVALSLTGICGAGAIGAAVIGATLIGPDSVLSLIKGLKAKLTD